MLGICSISPELGRLHVRSSPNVCMWRCHPLSALRYTLCTSGVMDDATFGHIDQEPRNRQRSCDSTWRSIDYTPWRILKLTHQRAAPGWGRSLMSTIALFFTDFARYIFDYRCLIGEPVPGEFPEIIIRSWLRWYDVIRDAILTCNRKLS